MSIHSSTPDRATMIDPYISIRSGQNQEEKNLKTISKNRLGLIRTEK